MSTGPTRKGPSLENRLPAEGINSSDEHPLKEFTWLIVASLVTVSALVALAGWGARWLAPRVPFSVEVDLVERMPDPPRNAEQIARSAALQAIAVRVAAQMGLPPDMPIVVSYDDSPLINAYASLGGRIRVFKGLLRELQTEDELVALLAHEIAHVKHRHVASNLGRGLAVALVLSMVSADAGATAAQSALGNAAGLALLGFSREQESEADLEAVRAVVALYGHAQGMIDLLKRLGEATAEAGPPVEVLNTHPLAQGRLAAVEAEARRRGWVVTGSGRPLPDALVLPRKTAKRTDDAARGAASPAN